MMVVMMTFADSCSDVLMLMIFIRRWKSFMAIIHNNDMVMVTIMIDNGD